MSLQKRAKHYFDFGDFRIDLGERMLLRNGQVVALTRKAFDTLLVLVENSGRVVEKEELFNRVWPDTFVAEVTLARNISTLRKVLEDQAAAHRYIETVSGRGYRFVAKVTETWEESDLARYEPKSNPANTLMPEAGISAMIERHTVSQIITEQEEIEIAQKGDVGRQLLPSATALLEKNRWVGSKRVTVLTAILLTASVTSVAVYIWIAGSTRQRVPTSAIRTVAVLPLKVINAESGDEYLGISIADRLIDDLGKLRQVIVRPTSAVLKYSARETNLLEAGSELGVEAVLVGSVQKTGERMRTNLQLVRISDGEVLWVKHFDGKFGGIFALQDEIADQVTQAMRLELREEERKQITSRGTENAQAYDAYMRGRFFWSKRTAEGMSKAIDYFKEAISLDSNYALAYSGLADCYALTDYSPLPLEESYQEAKTAAMNALKIDNSLAEAHTSLAWINLAFEWNWAGAEEGFKQAIELSPNYSTAHHWYGIYLSLIKCRYNESLAEIQKAQELDPTSLIINTNVGTLLLRARQDDEALMQLRKTVEMDPNFSLAHLRLGVAYAYKGMCNEAIASLQEAIALSKNEPSFVAQLGAIYAMSGQRTQSLKIIEDLKELHKRNRSMAGAIAAIYADLNEKEQALEWLIEAYEAHDPQLWLEINGDRRWDIFLHDANFQALLQRMGFKDSNPQ